MVNRICKNFIGLIALFILVFFLCWLNFAEFLARYMSIKAALDFQGYEPFPLHADELAGRVFGAFFPEATLSHFYAIIVSAFITVGLFMVFHLCFSILQLTDDRRAFTAMGDAQSARAALNLIVFDAAMAFAFLVPLILAILWDVDLFRYRSVANALGLDDPAAAPRMVEYWPAQLEKSGHLYAWDLTKTGAWGYVGVTAVSCLSLEYAWRKTVRTWDRFAAAMEDLVRVPGEDAGTAFRNEDPGLQTDQPPQDEKPATVRAAFPVVEVIPPPPCRGNGQSREAGDRVEVSAEEPRKDTPAHGTAEDERERDVIGAPGARVSLSAALADPARYWVDGDTREVWDAGYRQAITNTENQGR